MEEELYYSVFEKEESNWWYKYMWTVSRDFIRNLRKNNMKILDVGCGTGYNLLNLKEFGNVNGIDFSDIALKLCKKRGLKNVKKASVEKIPFKDNTFDLVTCFDVIYHKGVKNDLKALKEIKRVLKKNGYLLIREPAFKILFGDHDVKVHGIRRYNKREFKILLNKAGFKVSKIKYVNFVGFFPLLFIRNFQKVFKNDKKSDLDQNNFLEKIMKNLLHVEREINLNLPLGTSVIALVKK